MPLRYLRLCLILLGLLSCAGALAAEVPAPAIVGGSDVPEPNPYVYQVSIGSAGHAGTDSHFCGGALIAESWVLSAAHCFVDDASGAVTPPANLGVLIGLRDLRTAAGAPEAARSVARLIIHPQYDRASALNDIALLELGTPAPATLLVPLADTASEADRAAPGSQATATGWGGLVGYPPDQEGPVGGQQFPDTLQMVQLPIVASPVCAAAQGDIGPGQLCAGPLEGGKDTCQGDSGGPLVVSDGTGGYLQVGVVSTGPGCANPGSYGIYTRVSAYRSWMAEWVNQDSGPLTPQLYLPAVLR